MRFGSQRAFCSRAMDPIAISAASGMRSRLESLDLLANNIANVDTGGYKLDREFYNLYTSAESMAGDIDPSTLPVIEKNFTDFSQGTIRNTSNPLDVALQGSGFFTIGSPAGRAYTRNGAFRVSPAGTLVNSEGYGVLDTAGNPINVDPSLPLSIGIDGSVLQSGQSIAQLGLADFTPGQLVKQGNTLFHPADPNTTPLASSAEIQQGKLEGSNVGTAESAVRLVNVMRQFEMLQKALNIAGEMDRKTISDVAKVGP